MEQNSPNASWFEWIQRLLVIAGSISGLLIVAGYFVINGAFAAGHLRLPLYNVSLSQYISAGIYFLLELVVTTATGMLLTFYIVQAVFYSDRSLDVIDKYLPGMWKWMIIIVSQVIVSAINGVFFEMFVGFAIFAAVATVLVFIHVKYASQIQAFWDAKHVKFPALGRLIGDIRRWLVRKFPGWRKYLVVTLPFALIYCGIVCISNYTSVTPVIGGGAPTCVNLIFKDDDSVNLLDFTPHPSGNKRRTDQVEVLATTNEGYLVLDVGKGRAISVKSELLDGFVGCEPLPHYPTPTALPLTGTAIATVISTQSATSTFTMTATP